MRNRTAIFSPISPVFWLTEVNTLGILNSYTCNKFHVKQVTLFSCLLQTCLRRQEYPYLSSYFHQKSFSKTVFLYVLYKHYQQSYPQFSTKCLYYEDKVKDTLLVRPGRIELPSHPWQGRVLPLNHDRAEKMLVYYN